MLLARAFPLAFLVSPLPLSRFERRHRLRVCSNLSTQTSSSGLKTRHFGTIITELTACLRIHTESGSRLGGVSLEFTGELNEEGFSVTECVGGSMELSEEELGLRYQVCVLSLFRSIPGS